MCMADSGAMCHITNDCTGLYDTQVIKEPITIRNGQTVTAKLNRKLDQRVKTKNGMVIVTRSDVKLLYLQHNKTFMSNSSILNSMFYSDVIAWNVLVCEIHNQALILQNFQWP